MSFWHVKFEMTEKHLCRDVKLPVRPISPSHNCSLISLHAKSHQSCQTFCNPNNCSLPGSSVLGIFQARILKMGCHALLQGSFPTQGSDLHLLHCRQILYHWASWEDLKTQICASKSYHHRYGIICEAR